MLLVTLLIFIHLCLQVDSAEDTLKLVHVLFRHCDRTPDKKELYLKSPYYNESSFAPYGYGQLTNRGKQRCYELGQGLRNRYDGFLNASYHYSLVEATSTHFGRTKESLQLVLAGLFPPTKELKWSETLNWLPIATYYDKLGTEEVMYPSGTQRYAKEMLKFMQTEEYKALEAPFKDYMDYLSTQINETVDFLKMSYLDLGFGLTDEFGLKLPNWTQSIYPTEVDHSFIEFIASRMASKNLKRILGGPFFKKLIEDTEMKINGTLDPANKKIFIYAGHDITVSVFFSVLGIWNKTTPAVGSHCLFEVHQINGTYGFKLFFGNSSSAVPQLLFLPGFGEFVPLEELKRQKREFIELADLDEPSISIRPIGNLLFVFLFSYLISKI